MTEQKSWNAFTVEREDNIAQVTLIGPSKGNAMGPDFWSELPEIFADLDADPEVRAIVIAGSGKHFSFGLDLPAMSGEFGAVLADKAQAGPRTKFHDMIKRMQSGINAVADCRKPVVAAVQGWCIGGGVDLITAADIRYASADAKFSIREVKVAIVADMGSLARLPAIIGDGHLRELALTGKDIDAARAEKIGLVNDVFDDADAVLAAARDRQGDCAQPAARRPRDQGRARSHPQRERERQPSLRRSLERGVPAFAGSDRGHHRRLPEAPASLPG